MWCVYMATRGYMGGWLDGSMWVQGTPGGVPCGGTGP